MEFLDNKEVRDFNNIELLAKQVVEGFIIGLHKSPFHGFSVEFAEHRLYNQGEATKNIDWKVYARTEKLFTKKYEEETNLRCQIVVDASSSMYFPQVNKKSEAYNNKLRFAALSAAALMNLLKKQRDAFGLSVFDDKVKIQTRVKSSTSHYRLLLTHLDQLVQNPVMNQSTSAAKSLHEIADSIHRRSMVVIFSDMFEHMEDGGQELFNALQHLKHNKHEVILFHTVDKSKELNFEFDNRPYLFVDMETGERVKLQSNQIRDRYIEQVKTFTDDLKMKCMQYKIDFIQADIDKGFSAVLNAYLVKRAKMRI